MIAALVALLFYVVILVTAGKRYALPAVLSIFAVAYVAPLVQTFYARKQADRTRETAARDAHRFAKELAEYAKKPHLHVLLDDGNTTDFRPASGHRSPSAAVVFRVSVVNTGDAPAVGVVARIGLAKDVRQVLLPPKHLMVSDGEGTQAWVAVDDASDTQLVFAPDATPPALASEVAVVELRRPLLPHQPRVLGTVAMIAPEGTHRFPWIIESASGTTRSTIDTALEVIVHDAGLGHDAVPASERPAERCMLCRARAKMPAWTARVDRELNKFRGDRRANPERAPRLTTSAGGAQWQQDVSGPQRWVTCSVIPGRDDAVRADFWVNGEWEQREERIVALSDAVPFAADVWEYLKTATVIELAEARVARAR